jgi:hypothetical protein
MLTDWAAGRYHAMPFTCKAVEAAMEERIDRRPWEGGGKQNRQMLAVFGFFALILNGIHFQTARLWRYWAP